MFESAREVRVELTPHAGKFVLPAKAHMGIAIQKRSLDFMVSGAVMIFSSVQM
jgi:hypothetical protein